MAGAVMRRSRGSLRLVPPAPQQTRIACWGPLAEPVDPLDTLACMRAQSILTPTPRGGACPPLTIAQARDVLAWYCPAKP